MVVFEDSIEAHIELGINSQEQNLQQKTVLNY